MYSAVPLLRRVVVYFSPQRPVFDSRTNHVDFLVDKMALGPGFLRVLRFLLPILIPAMLHTHQPSVSGTVGHSVADVPSVLSFTPPHGKKLK
jgi:hypothetical protein